MSCFKTCFSSNSVENKVNPEHNNSNGTVNHADNDHEFISKDRKRTDALCLLLMLLFLIVLIGLLGYCMSYGDIYRIINGYDDCGNVCGRYNKPLENIRCSGVDHSNKKFLLVNQPSGYENMVFRTCVETCVGRTTYRRFINRCLPLNDNQSNTNPNKLSFFSKTGVGNFFQEVSEDLQYVWIEIFYLCCIALVISLLIVFALKYIAAFVVWIVLIGIILALLFGAIFLWADYAYLVRDSRGDTFEKSRETMLAGAIIVSIVTLVVIALIYSMRSRISLVIELFKEAGKALINMPLLLFEPILTFLAFCLVFSFWIFLAIGIESSGYPVLQNNQSVKFVKNTTMLITRWYNLFGLFWFVNFIMGCQHMIVSGAVATWFFTRNKAKLDSPIIRSFKNLVIYHLGTVAMGSFFIGLLNLLRAMLKSVMYALSEPQNKIFQILHNACQCCFFLFENFLKFITRNAYIETAITGQAFCEAGKRAFNILSSNALRVFAINSVGDFVLLLAKCLVVLVTVLIGVEAIEKKDGVHHPWVPLILVGLFTYFVAHCFISIYEMTIDTIFICFCEDCELNDGINRPYFMSRGLMEFVQNSKKVLQIDEKMPTKAWSETEKPSTESQ